MSRTTTREIVRVCAELDRLDRRSKEIVIEHLQEELAKAPVAKGSAVEKEGV